MTNSEKLDVLVVGAGQAGLAAGYYLARRGMRFMIVDGATRIGDSWRRRWDSLRLFTPSQFDGLPGLPFPAPANAFPTKDEVADYLESYARRFALPVRLETRVAQLSREHEGYVARTSSGVLRADQVIVAMAPFQTPRVPAFAGALGPDIVQLHSSEYRRSSQLADGPALVVGAGNSGAEIALDLARAGDRKVILAGCDTGHVPFAIDGLASRLLLSWVVLHLVFHQILKITTPIGRRARRRMRGKGAPLIRTKPRDLWRAGVRRVARVARAERGLPVVEGGEHLDVKNVIWTTGFRPGFSWIDLPIFDAAGEPRHDAGIVPGERGFYFLGLDFLYSMSSSMLHGVGRDASRVVEALDARRVKGLQ